MISVFPSGLRFSSLLPDPHKIDPTAENTIYLVAVCPFGNLFRLGRVLKSEFLQLTERLKTLQQARDSVSELIASEDDDDNIRNLLKRKKEISYEIDQIIKEIDEYIQFAGL